MKKLIIMFIVMTLLCSCSKKQPEQEEPVEETKTAEVTEYEVPNSFKDNCVFGEFDKFNSYASENGLAGTMIWLEGSYDEIEALTIENQKGYITQFKDADNHKWLLLLDLDLYNSIETFESLLNHPLVVIGAYQGYSDKYNMPAFNMKALFDKQTGLTLSSTLFRITNEDTVTDNSSSTVDTQTNESTDNTEEIDENVIRPEIKEAIDSFEAFIDEYCAFMVKYSESDGKDLSALADYANFIAKLADMESKMDKLEEDFTEAESYYYAEVSLRCSQKLLEASR